MIHHVRLTAAFALAAVCGCGESAPTGSSPPVGIAADHLEIREGGSKPADDRISPGAPIVVTGTVKSTTRPNRSVMVSVIAVDSQGRQRVHDSGGGTWVESDADDTWGYEGSISAPSQPGRYTVIVRYGREALDEQEVNIVDAASAHSD